MSPTSPADLMTMSEIARAAGVPVATVSSWKRRSPETFPPEVKDPALGKRARYERTTVEKWLATVAPRGHDTKSNQRTFSHIVSALRGQLDPLDTLDLIGALLVTLKAHPDALEGFNGVDGHYIERLLHEPGPVPFDFHDPYARVDADTLVNVAWGLREVKEPADFLADAIEQTNNRLLGKLPQTTTPEPLTQFLMTISPDGGSSAFDPAAGTGRLLRTAILEGKASHATGIEVDIRTALTARRIAYLSGLDIDIKLGNALRLPPESDAMADLVLCDAPLGMKWEPETYPRGWTFGQPPASRFDLGWVQLALEHLTPGGRGLVITPPAALWRGGTEAAIRSALIRQGAVHAVITLPARLRMDTGIPLTVWVLGAAGRPRADVLLVDASRRGRDELEPIGELVRAWLDGERPELDPTEAAAVSTVELLTPEVDLNPARWVKVPGEDKSADEWKTETREAVERAQTALKTVGGSIHTIDVHPVTDLPQLTVADLKKDGRVEIRRGRVWDQADAGDGPRILNPRILREGEIEGTDQGVRRAVDDGKVRQNLIHPGDIIVFSTSNAVDALVWQEDGWVAGSLMQVIRILDPHIDPHYLTAALRHPRNQALLMGSAVRAQFRLEDFAVPLPSPADQQAYAQIGRALDDRVAKLKATIERVQQARDAVSAAATSGVVVVRTHD